MTENARINRAEGSMNIKPKGKYGPWVPYLLMIADFIVLNAVLFIVFYWKDSLPTTTFRTLLVLANAAYLPVAQYSLPLRRLRAVHMERLVAKAFKLVGMHALIFFALITFLRVDGVRWLYYLEFYIGLLVATPLSWIVSRLIVKALRRRGRNYVNVIIIGHGDTAMRLVNELQQDPGFGYKIHGFFDVEQPEHYSLGRYLGNISEDLPAYLAEHNIEEIYYTRSGADEERLRTVIRLADANMAAFYFVPTLSRSVARSFHLTHIGSLPVLAAHNNPLDNTVNRLIKRAFDVVVSSCFLIVSPLIFIPVAIAIKMSSPGPIFFKQRRTGYLGHEFTCWKFRTMRVNNDADNIQATAHDPRKTRVGDFLRRTSIDELPQFYNVLMGDMSVVGPRPHMVKHTADYSRLIDHYMLRHIIKPGITGWAQVMGYRGATNELWQMEGRVEKDVWYIENWSLGLDIKIIIRTITNAISGEENAY